MKVAPRQLWLSVSLGIVGLIAGYTFVLFSAHGTAVFAASATCPNSGGVTCTKENCPHKAGCASGTCKGTCAGCTGK